MLPLISDYLKEKNLLNSSEEKRNQQWHYWGQRNSGYRRVASFLVFANGQPEPMLMVKYYRHPCPLERLFAQNDILEQLHRLNSRFISQGLPRPILFENKWNSWVAVETALCGSPMTGTSSMRAVATDLSVATNWLLQFREESKELRKLVDKKVLMDQALNLKKQLETVFELNAEEKAYLETMLEIMDKEFPAQVATEVQHGDFYKENIIKNGCRLLKVGYWDFCHHSALIEDLLFFLITYPFPNRDFKEKQTCLELFQQSFFSQQPYAMLAKKQVFYYISKANFNQKLVEPSLALLLVKLALIEYHFLLETAEQGYLPLLEGRIGSSNKGGSYHKIIKDHIWINLFKRLVKQEKNLIFK